MNCKNCGNELKGKGQIIFCSQSCAASFNNIGVRRHGYPENYYNCQCGRQKDYKAKFCLKCKKENTRKNLLKKIIGDIPKKNRVQILRNMARIFLEETQIKKSCKICGYNKHVDVCHIKPIKSFLESDLIGDVNNVKNLEYMCPNHHWEFDHGLIV